MPSRAGGQAGDGDRQVAANIDLPHSAFTAPLSEGATLLKVARYAATEGKLRNRYGLPAPPAPAASPRPSAFPSRAADRRPARAIPGTRIPTECRHHISLAWSQACQRPLHIRADSDGSSVVTVACASRARTSWENVCPSFESRSPPASGSTRAPERPGEARRPRCAPA